MSSYIIGSPIHGSMKQTVKGLMRTMHIAMAKCLGSEFVLQNIHFKLQTWSIVNMNSGYFTILYTWNINRHSTTLSRLTSTFCHERIFQWPISRMMGTKRMSREGVACCSKEKRWCLRRPTYFSLMKCEKSSQDYSRVQK